MQYVIVRTAAVVPAYEGERPYLVSTVYGPFDEQGCSRAYKIVRGAFPEADLTVRGLLPVDLSDPLDVLGEAPTKLGAS